VLYDILCDNNPWIGVERGDGRRKKVLDSLLNDGLITLSYNYSLGWITREGICALPESRQYV
jgi:hypothetical protein